MSLYQKLRGCEGMTYEPTSKKNPHQLTKKQHFHSAHAISKFHNAEGKVDLYYPKTGKRAKGHSRSKEFYTLRNWDQRAETTLMWPIEKAFHHELNQVSSLSERNHEAISEYLLLWHLRHELHCNRLDDAVLSRGYGDRFTKEQEERLEYMGCLFVRADGTVPARFLTGDQLQLKMIGLRPRMKGVKWGRMTAKEGSFLATDCCPARNFIPISPTQAFYNSRYSCEDRVLSRGEVASLNQMTLGMAHEFCYAQDLSLCPGVVIK